MGEKPRLVFDFNARSLRRVLLLAPKSAERLSVLVTLREGGHDVVAARDLSELQFATDAITWGFGLRPHVVVFDPSFADGAGTELVARYLPSSRVVLVFERGERADKAIARLSPWALLERPFDWNDLALAVSHARLASPEQHPARAVSSLGRRSGG